MMRMRKTAFMIFVLLLLQIMAPAYALAGDLRQDEAIIPAHALVPQPGAKTAKSTADFTALNKMVLNSYLVSDRILQQYLQPSRDVESDHPAVIAQAREILEKSNAQTDFEKVRAIHDWVADNIYYDYMFYYGYAPSTVYDASEVLETRYTVCSGYSRLTAALLRASGIPCRTIPGAASGVTSFSAEFLQEYNAYRAHGSLVTFTSNAAKYINHEWNAAYADGRWILMDVTWDSNNHRGTDGTMYKRPIRRTYFDPDIAAFSRDHAFWFADLNPKRIILDRTQIDDFPSALVQRINIVATEPEIEFAPYNSHDYYPFWRQTRQIEWTSSNENVAVVQIAPRASNQYDLVLRGVGKATLTCRIGDAMATCEVICRKRQPLTGFTLNKTEANLTKGKTLQMKVKKYLPLEHTSKIKTVWKSSNSKVAKIDKSGLVTAKNPGKTYIRCTITTSEGNTFTQKCTLYVK